MDILKLAQESGMLVVLDARIGNAEYHSVHGSVSSLVNFARAIIEVVEELHAEEVETS